MKSFDCLAFDGERECVRFVSQQAAFRTSIECAFIYFERNGIGLAQ